MLQLKVRILVESPLYFAGDLFDNDLIAREARILSIVHRQFGMYQLLRASQTNMRKSLGKKLEEKRVGLSYLTSGLYMPNYKDYIIVDAKKRDEEVKLIEADELACAINT